MKLFLVSTQSDHGWRFFRCIEHFAPMLPLNFSREAQHWGFFFFLDDRLYSAILHSLEQTYCACMWFYMSD